MTTSTRDTVLFWCQVALYLTIMGAIITVLCLFAFWLNTFRLDMQEDRARDRAMLQQHLSVLQDHDRAREQHAMEFKRTLQHHEETMERLRH